MTTKKTVEQILTIDEVLDEDVKNFFSDLKFLHKIIEPHRHASIMCTLNPITGKVESEPFVSERKDNVLAFLCLGLADALLETKPKIRLKFLHDNRSKLDGLLMQSLVDHLTTYFRKKNNQELLMYLAFTAGYGVLLDYLDENNKKESKRLNAGYYEDEFILIYRKFYPEVSEAEINEMLTKYQLDSDE